MTDFSDTTLIKRDSFFWTPDYMDVSAWIEHLPFAFWLIEVAKPKVMVELGVHTGTSYFTFCQAIKHLNINAAAYGIDTWKGDEHAGFYSDTIFNKVSAWNDQRYSRFSTLIRSSFDEAREYFVDGSIELLHIDGFHTYEAVKHDFETWLPKLAKNAIVLFHDINVRREDFGVFQYWAELTQQYPHFQFDFGYGLGVLCIGKDFPNELALLFNKEKNEDYYLFLRNIFADRGAQIRQIFYADLELKNLRQENARLNENVTTLQESLKTLQQKFKNDLIELSEKLNAANFTYKSHSDELSSVTKRIEHLTSQLLSQEQAIKWYRATYEDRSLLGILKEKLLGKKKIAHRGVSGPYSELYTSPNSKHNYVLHPANGISYDPVLKVFSCNSEDPYFVTDLKSYLPEGWYLLTINVKEIKYPLFSPKIYYNIGGGFNEFDIWNLPVVENGKIETLIHFPGKVYQLRFDPSTVDCTFQITGFNLKPLNKIKALSIAVSGYRQKYFPNKSNFSFLLDSIIAFLKTGKPTLRKKISDFIYKKEVLSEDEAYTKWVIEFDTLTDNDIKAVQSLSQGLPYQPLFSIVMPVYNAPVKWLKKAIDSVIDQAYPNWELCIADDRSTHNEVIELLKEYQKKDSRIKVVYREENGHISHASNSALQLASGDYIALLDQDDELRPHSLYMVAKAINENKDLALIYSDEDKLDEEGNRFSAYFKTDWNPDLFYGQNMINHLGVYKHSLIKKIGGFRPGYEGSQDHDLILRCLEHIQLNQIHHIPHILYHWRAIKGSTSDSMSNKSYAVDAGVRALQDHFDRTNQKATVEQNVYNSYRVKWDLPGNQPMVSIIIPTKDKVEILATCVTSILERTAYTNYEVLIVDNNSEQAETYAYLKNVQEANKQVHVLSYQAEFNFSAIINYGVQRSKGEVMLLLNNDTEVINKDWLHEMVSQVMRKDIGAVGAKLYYPNGQIQHGGVFLYEGNPGNHIYLKRDKTDPGYFNKLNLVQNYSAVTAACLAVRKEVFLEAGGLDEQNLKVAYNDVDFCLKVRELGYRNLWTPFAQLFHYESLSRGSDMNEKNFLRFKKEHSFMLAKWKDAIAVDPYFNPNLGIETYTTHFAFPPKVRYEWEKPEKASVRSLKYMHEEVLEF